VVAKLNPPGMAANTALSYRVTVLEDPTLNAFAYPNGSIYVHTGLLARMDDEDELATVLGHEMTHVEGRHMLRYQRSVRNKQIGFAVASVAGAVIVAGAEGRAAERGDYAKAAQIRVLSDLLVGLGLELAIIAAVNGYGRDLEREADEGGFQKMRAAGYDVREAPKVYETLLEDYGDSGKTEAFFFGSHPRLAERVAAAKAAAAAEPGEPPAPLADRDEFARRIRPVVRDDARLNIEMGRLALAQDELDRVMRMMPGDPEAHYLVGRLGLRRAEAEKDPMRQKSLRAEAMASFREAIRLDPNRPGPHREVGLLAYEEGDFATACVSFRLYLETDPKADDAQRIRDYLLEMERDGRCNR
jgi:predicted Zn-dependent protease